MPGAVAGGGDAVVAFDQRNRVGEVFVGGAVAEDCGLPELAFLRVAAGVGEDYRQGHLALAEIVAPVLAHLGRVGRIVERVVDQLERDAEVATVIVERLLLRVAAFGDHRRNAAGGGEQRGGFRADDVEIALFAGGDLALRGQLGNLALRDDRAGGAEDLQHFQAAILCHQLERAAEQEIADQHGRRIAEDDVRRRLAPAHLTAIDHIVVQQRGGMDELDRGGELVVARAVIADQLRPGERQHRAQPLASARDQVTRKARDKRNFALHPIEDHGVDRVHSRRGEREHRIDRGFGCARRFTEWDDLGGHYSGPWPSPAIISSIIAHRAHARVAITVPFSPQVGRDCRLCRRKVAAGAKTA